MCNLTYVGIFIRQEWNNEDVCWNFANDVTDFFAKSDNSFLML